MTPSTEAVEALAARMAAADQIDWNETCGYQTDRDDCDSSTCVAAAFEDHDAEWARNFYRRFARTALTYVRPFEGMEAALTYLPAGWAWSIGQMMGLPEKYRYRCFISDHNTPDGLATYHLHGEAPTAVEAIRAAIDILHDYRPEVPRVEAAPLPALCAGNVFLEAAARAYFERGFMACYAWQYTNAGAQLSDTVLDRAWDHREEGGELPAFDRPRAAAWERDDIAAAIEEMTRADWDAWVAEASGSRMHSASVAGIYRKADAILALQSPRAKVEPKPQPVAQAWGDIECSGCTLPRRDCECN